LKIALFNDNRLGVVADGRVYDLTGFVPWDSHRPQESLENFMGQYAELAPQIEARRESCPSHPLHEVKLRAPVPKPGKILAAPVNYLNHQSEMNAQFNNAPFTIEKLGLFLKAPSSIIGPGETVYLPSKERRYDYEAELAFVIGKKAKNVPPEKAGEYIFGYFALMDMTLRGGEDRSWRKSFDTCTPIGPWIVTGDEIPDPNALQIRLWVNDELKQDANVRDTIWNCCTCLAKASEIMTLYPGDIITTGTPEGIGPITKGDRVRIHVESIGEFSVNVDFAEEQG